MLSPNKNFIQCINAQKKFIESDFAKRHQVERGVEKKGTGKKRRKKLDGYL